MSVLLYHLQALARFHLGRRGVGIEESSVYAPSDTVFSALCHALREGFGAGAVRNLLNDPGWADDPPLRLSSAFPYVLTRREGETEGWRPPVPFDPTRAVRFFPRPLADPPGVPDDPEQRKNIKRIAWVSEVIFREWVAGRSLAAHLTSGTIAQGDVWLSKEEAARVAGWRDEESDEIRLWQVGDVPRVTVDRLSSRSQVYQAGCVAFQDSGGLWLLACWRDDWRERCDNSLRILADSGLGGERSGGHGQFLVHGPHPFDLMEPAAGGLCITLALYHPTDRDIMYTLGEKASYRLVWRRGWMASPDAKGSALQRKAVRMVDQGSILTWPAGCSVVGDLVDVTPDVFTAHRVYRYGLAWPVGYAPAGGKT